MGLFKSVFNYIFKEKEIIKNNTELHTNIKKDDFFEYLESKLNNY